MHNAPQADAIDIDPSQSGQTNKQGDKGHPAQPGQPRDGKEPSPESPHEIPQTRQDSPGRESSQ